MSIKQRDEHLYKVLRAMRFEMSIEKRYHLQIIGESLIGEYKDLKLDDPEMVELRSRG